jgi:hypothetical protein
MQAAAEASVNDVEVSAKRSQLVDEIRGLEAQIAGKRIEFCMLIGDREGAERYRKDMYDLIEARKAAVIVGAEETGGCFFEATGRADGMAPVPQ